jgi:hypothetical protein
VTGIKKSERKRKKKQPKSFTAACYSSRGLRNGYGQ